MSCLSMRWLQFPNLRDICATPVYPSYPSPHGATCTQPCPFSLPAQTLGLTGAQTTQLLVEPLWRPAVLWDWVTLTCQGLGTAGATTWYKGGVPWERKGPDNFTVTGSGIYQCYRHDTGFSFTVKVSDGVPVSGVSVWAQPPGGQVALGDHLVLSCAVAKGTGPLSFTWHWRDLGALLGIGPHLELHHTGDNDSGHYHCRVSNGDSVAESFPLDVTVLVPVTNATITPSPLSHQVHTGDNVTLCCSVQVGSAPVTFTWLHDGQEVAWGPILELGDIDVGHSGTYQCVATNQLGQDGHRVFRARSPEVALEVTPGSLWVTGVPVSGVSVWAQPPGGQVALGDHLVLSCAVAKGTGPLSFTWHWRDLGALLGIGPHLELHHTGDNDSGHYHCRVSNGDSVAESFPLDVTVLVPVTNATITPSPLSHQVHTGDNVTLCCSVQVGSAPVTFTWLHDGQEVAWGPILELGDIDVGHSGTYQCVATNQLGQDGHRVFRARSPEVALEVTPGSLWVTAVAVNVGRTLLFLALLLAVIGGCHCWHHQGG
ncbi:hypothetical protein HGM15179_018478 [Zosterops borbonicus]|uniref:Ig-like domain-containing protein n=1 Tax=Zosterops borbonicus TaxID=364589 RepID=A0A8K1FYY9_9PASS|nr:hypothetical protein HGM15179_018478 [Zosterops borbonicus]